MEAGFVALAYVLVLTGYGIVRGGRVRSYTDFTGRALEPPLFVMAASMCASFIGGGFSLGNAERAFQSGLVNTLLLWGFSLGQIVVGLLFAGRFSALRRVSTPGGVIGTVSGDGPRMLCGVLSVFYCVGVLGAQVRAIGLVGSYLFAAPAALCSLIGFAVLLVYSTLGGLRASVRSDFLQILFLAFGLLAGLAAASVRLGGLAGLKARLPESFLSLTGKMSAPQIVSAMSAFAVGEMLCPPSVQRMLLSRNPARVRAATLLSALVSIPFFAVTGFIGLYARSLGTTGNPAFAMPSLLSGVLFFPLGALICAAMLCVYLSSGGAFLSSCAACLTEDLLPFFRHSCPDDAAQLRTIRISNVVCGLAALALAMSFDDVLSILVFSYSFWAPVVLVPLVAALYGRGLCASRFFACCAIACAALIGWRAAGSPFGVSPLIAGLFADIVAFWALSASQRFAYGKSSRSLV